MSWREQAACSGVAGVVFESRDPEVQARVLLAYCAQCPVRQECEVEARRMGDHRWTVRGSTIVGPVEKPRRWVPPTDHTCGTPRGVNRHRNQRTPLCTPCHLVQRARNQKRNK